MFMPCLDISGSSLLDSNEEFNHTLAIVHWW
jgi:hypothetical protein